MKAIQKVIYTGFAAVAIASAAMPVFPAHIVPARGAACQGVDFGAVKPPAEREFGIRR